nr:response regulator transcription factor [uncultured Merdimonas sp.]
MYQILIVEDDRGLNQGIALALRQDGLSFWQTYTKAEGLECWRKNQIDMALLDVNLPDGSGYELLEEIRRYSQIPVLLITANDLESDEITGFSLGADDYITKPFSLMALRARVERIRIRTGEGKKKNGEYQDSHYQFRFDAMQFFVDGQEIELSRTEQRLLGMFVRHPGQTLSRDQLTEILWPGGAEYVEENALSVAVGRLRRKLSGKEKYRPIETVYGIGYVWEKQI